MIDPSSYSEARRLVEQYAAKIDRLETTLAAAEPCSQQQLAGRMGVSGPAIVELAFSTLVLRPGDVARAAESGDVVVDIG